MRMKCFGIYCVRSSPQGIITSPRPHLGGKELRAVEDENKWTAMTKREKNGKLKVFF